MDLEIVLKVLQPQSQQLGSYIYEHFEKDPVKYNRYQNALQKAVEDLPKEVKVPVVMIVGAGRGPFVQTALNVSKILNLKMHIYALDKNPFAINTLVDRNIHEWNNEIILVDEDMRLYNPPEKANILVSEIMGPMGDDQLCPECLDGAQRFLTNSGVSIPTSYTSFLAPIQSFKVFNEIVESSTVKKSLASSFETSFIAHLVNYYQIAPAQPLYTFTHPNWEESRHNERYKKLRFEVSQSCVLTCFAGFFDAVLYKELMLQVRLKDLTHRVTWFPIVFPIGDPLKLKAGDVVELAFWRVDGPDKVWYEWCLESPVKRNIMNPGGRSYMMKKH